MYLNKQSVASETRKRKISGKVQTERHGGNVVRGAFIEKTGATLFFDKIVSSLPLCDGRRRLSLSDFFYSLGRIRETCGKSFERMCKKRRSKRCCLGHGRASVRGFVKRFFKRTSIFVRDIFGGVRLRMSGCGSLFLARALGVREGASGISPRTRNGREGEGCRANQNECKQRAQKIEPLARKQWTRQKSGVVKDKTRKAICSGGVREEETRRSKRRQGKSSRKKVLCKFL